jgi:hypothetical protein
MRSLYNAMGDQILKLMVSLHGMPMHEVLATGIPEFPMIELARSRWQTVLESASYKKALKNGELLDTPITVH